MNKPVLQQIPRHSYDVLIMGGGLAGLTLAIQLKRRRPGLHILVAEKSSYPAPEAAHKVGESSVEIASYYFEHVLGLKTLLDNELPKLGLRFFYSFNNNHDISKRIELGPNDFPMAKSYQLDRGRFENALVQHCLELDIDFLDDCKITALDLGQYSHRISLQHKQQLHDLQSTWLIDASGRMSLLKRKLQLSKPAYHDVNASWFRINHKINIDDWNDNPQWQGRVKAPRRLSTNHLLGKGYWVWLIPLSSGATSIGIVADAKIHPYKEINTLPRAMTWLQQHEPQCAQIIQQHLHQQQDFLTLKHYAHNCKQMFSANGWAITGDAGIFLDPFYSPGSDFIALNNSFITELIVSQQEGADVKKTSAGYEKLFRTLFLAFCPVYEDQYPIMGNAKVMIIKTIWDYTLYWSGVALLFFADKFSDLDFMQSSSGSLQRIYQLNVHMQTLLRNWAELDVSSENKCDIFINYSKIEFLQRLNKGLLIQHTDTSLQQQLAENIRFIEQLSDEISHQATSCCAELQGKTPVWHQEKSAYLKSIFAQFAE